MDNQEMPLNPEDLIFGMEKQKEVLKYLIEGAWHEEL